MIAARRNQDYLLGVSTNKCTRQSFLPQSYNSANHAACYHSYHYIASVLSRRCWSCLPKFNRPWSGLFTLPSSPSYLLCRLDVLTPMPSRVNNGGPARGSYCDGTRKRIAGGTRRCTATTTTYCANRQYNVPIII